MYLIAKQALIPLNRMYRGDEIAPTSGGLVIAAIGSPLGPRIDQIECSLRPPTSFLKILLRLSKLSPPSDCRNTLHSDSISVLGTCIAGSCSEQDRLLIQDLQGTCLFLFTT